MCSIARVPSTNANARSQAPSCVQAARIGPLHRLPDLAGPAVVATAFMMLSTLCALQKTIHEQTGADAILCLQVRRLLMPLAFRFIGQAECARRSLFAEVAHGGTHSNAARSCAVTRLLRAPWHRARRVGRRRRGPRGHHGAHRSARLRPRRPGAHPLRCKTRNPHHSACTNTLPPAPLDAVNLVQGPR